MKQTPEALYNSHKAGAKRRNIAFKFTLEEWIGWWEQHLGPDWMTKRGRLWNQYVMARKGDVGPYEAVNVLCVTAAQNSEMRRKYEKHKPHSKRGKLTAEQAKQIYLAHESQNELARQFGVSARLVRMIKAGKLWQKVINSGGSI